MCPTNIDVLQAKINDRGIAAVAYNVLIRPGVSLGLGMSLDTQNLKEASHKVGKTCHVKAETDMIQVGTSFEFSA